MSYEVLARKWRPQVFQDVVGQEHVTQTLMNAVRKDRLAHAFLFSGARGVGKTSVARILAKAVNCEQGEPGIPCNQCRSCREITDGSSVDVQEIDGASNRGIDEIRELREHIKYMPSASRYRVYIIDEVHMLTLHAFNAILKTLEEPPPHAKFIFATTEPHKVPVTILSRCQRFDFRRIPLEKLSAQLERIARAEGVEISRASLALIAGEAEGSMRDAESLMDQILSFTGPKVRDEDIMEILGLIDRSLLLEVSLAVIERSPRRCLEIVDRIYNHGYDIKEFYRGLLDQFRNLLVSLVVPDSDLLDVADSDRVEIQRQAEMAGMERTQRALSFLIAREEDFRFSFHPRLLLETVLIKLCQMGEALTFDELIGKLEKVERRLSSPCPPDGVTLERPPDAGAGREQAKPEPEDSKSEPAEKDWDRLLAYLAVRNRPMANVLKEWDLAEMTRDTLALVRGSSPFSASYLDEPDRLNRFAEYCRECFKRDLAIKVLDRPKDRRRGPPPAGPSSEAATREKSDLPPNVRDVLQVFQGEIMEEAADGGDAAGDRRES